MVFKLLKYYIVSKLILLLPESIQRKLQLRKFRRIFEWAKHNSAFYHDIYEKAGINNLKINSFADIEKIPVVDKDLMLQTPKENLLTTPLSEDLAENSSSGSTGKPMTVYATKKDYLTSVVRTFMAIKGYNPFKRIVFIGMHEEKERNEKHTLVYYLQKYFGLFEREKYSVYMPSGEIIDKLYGREISTLSSTPSIVKLLIEELKESRRILNINYVVLSGETVFGDLRNDIKTYLKAKVIDVYGCTELLSMAWTKPDKEDFNYLPNTVFVEYVNPVEIDGEHYGELVITNLLNKTQPFVRYNIRDLVKVPVATNRMGNIIGRIEDHIDLEGGEKLHRLEFCTMYKPLKECRQFRIIKKKDKRIYFQAICKAKKEESEIKEKIIDIWEKQFLGVPLEVQFFKELPLSSKTGKFKIIEQES